MAAPSRVQIRNRVERGGGQKRTFYSCGYRTQEKVARNCEDSGGDEMSWTIATHCSIAPADRSLIPARWVTPAVERFQSPVTPSRAIMSKRPESCPRCPESCADGRNH